MSGILNVGKSTLMNSLVGERISIITSKAQTTRHRIMGIVNTEDMQIVYSDTPGVLVPNYKLQESMLEFFSVGITRCRYFALCDRCGGSSAKNQSFLDKVARETVPVLVVINKIDLLKEQSALETLVEEWKQLLPNAEIIPVSAQYKFNLDYLLKRIQELLPPSPPFFEKSALTDKPARFFVTEIIREKILQTYDKEIPYACEVAVEQFQEEENRIHIMAVIYVERDSQKGIVIGKGGSALKKVGTLARKDIEVFFDKKVFLELYVKVEKDWRSRENKLKGFGYIPE